MKRIAVLSTLAVSSLAAAAARAETIVLTPSDDTYVRLDNGNGYGTEGQLAVNKVNNGASGKNRKTILEFANPGGHVRAASLSLRVLNFSDPGSLTSATFQVWGVRDGVSGCAESFNEGSAKNSTFPYLDTSPDGVQNEHACLHDGDPSTPGSAQALGTFTVLKTDVGETVTFSSPALADFLNRDTNGVVTLAITADTNHSSLVTTFAAKEHSVGQPPRLTVERGALVRAEDVPGAVPNGDGSFHFDGDLRLPLAQGTELTLPGASVDMTFDASGDLHTISGTVGFPELPGMGLFSGLGGLSSSGPALQIGYDYPSAFNSLDLPLDDGERYFYFLQQAGASIEWGPVSASSPDAGSTLIALEPLAPALFFYTDQLLPESPITSVSLGVSGSNTIEFDPWYTAGVESKMKRFDGDLYLGGSIAIPTGIPSVDLAVAGDMTVNVDDGVFTSGNPVGWMEDLGANADVSLEAGLGVFGLSYYLGGASLRFHGGGTPWLAFSGVIEPDDLGGLPFVPKGSMYAAGYLSGDVATSFLEVDGELQFPGAFSAQKIEATVRVDSAGAELDGKVKFMGTTMSVQGSVYPAHASFSGSLSHQFDAYVGKVKATVKGKFDSRQQEVELECSAKFCVKNLITNKDECTSVGAGVSLTGSGRIKVCATIPGHGQACDTLT